MEQASKGQVKIERIYLNIDHLNKGDYQLDILLKNEVIKSVKITKQY